MNAEFRRKFQEYKQSIQSTKPTVKVVESEFETTGRIFLNTYGKYLLFIVLTISLFINLVTFPIYSTWNDFLMSPEYRQYEKRVGK